MGAPKGHPNWGGRPKGSPNKNNLRCREAVDGYLGRSLFEEILETARKINNPKDRIEAIAIILPYYAPKLEAIAIQADINTNQIEGTNEQAIKFVEAVVSGSDRPGSSISVEAAVQEGLIPIREGLPGVQGS